MRADTYQVFLITAGIIVTMLLGIFFYREIFPEYKIYQKDYIALDEFHSTYSHQPATKFKEGIKQIVITRADNGPPEIDRCISCHVALQIPYFSPTKIAKDLNDNIMYDVNGKPIQIPNENYIWKKLDDKISELRDSQVIAHLKERNETNAVKQRLKLADDYEGLKTAKVRDQVYDVTKVLVMHPLISHETRPFEFHPVEEYGCVSCHSGNGRGLVTDRAHGPVFDGRYEEENEGLVPEFIEKDPKNDPRFSRMFNAKPGSRLIFQTTPLLVGSLIQAKCMNCHQTSHLKLDSAVNTTSELTRRRDIKVQILLKSYDNDRQTLLDLLKITRMIEEKGHEQTLQALQELTTDYSLSESELKRIHSQIKYLKINENEQAVNEDLDQTITSLLGSKELVAKSKIAFQEKGLNGIDEFIKNAQTDPSAHGTLFIQAEALKYNQDLLLHAKEVKNSFESAIKNQKNLASLNSDVDNLTRNYQRGKELYLSQACYACHRIAGYTRGGIGPELTKIGESYPWYIKQSIVWPQADLSSSTMPNMRLDHLEIEDLMAFLLAQRGGNLAVAETAYQADLLSWEGGKKSEWEKPIQPARIYDIRYAMTVFATEGCAACHRLEGYESNVGFKVEKDPGLDFDMLYEKQHWFKQLFPEIIHINRYDEELPGSHIVASLEKFKDEIDEQIVSDVRQNSLLEEISRNHPQVVESFYSNFRYASRAKNDHYERLLKNELDLEKVTAIRKEQKEWQDRVHKVLMMYIQTYGLGRLIGPHLNWSGIYRSDQWLMEHFKNPAGHVPRSIMPIFPFDDTKFYSLTHMLDKLSLINRQKTRDIWTHRGFNPQEAFDVHCAQCHGMTFYGNGAIAEWIFPLPKNLRNSEFLRNLTKEQVFLSIKNGVKGTPMPPWGEVAQDKPHDIASQGGQMPVLTESEIHYLVDWLFSSLPGGEVIKEDNVAKWKYGPEEILEELRQEDSLSTSESEKKTDHATLYLPKAKGLYASLDHKVYPDKQSKNGAGEIFDIIPNPSVPQMSNYYIKKKYYTPFNIDQGKQFFLLNCAVCHGNEGDGSGPRAEIMRDAKPRILNGLHWINSKDDVYLLRSIKYGVAGTSMTPWGDLTDAFQRLQLVVYIRTLSNEQIRREKLTNAIYHSFDTSMIEIDQVRSKQNEQTNLDNRLENLQSLQFSLTNQFTEEKTTQQAVLKNYEERLELEKKIHINQNQDEQFQALKAEVKRERDLYFNLGMTFLSQKIEGVVIDKYLELIHLNTRSYKVEDNQLLFLENAKNDAQIRSLLEEILLEFDQKISELEKQKEIISGRMSSANRREELNLNQSRLDTLKKLKVKVVLDIEEALRSVKKQAQIVEEINHSSG